MATIQSLFSSSWAVILFVGFGLIVLALFLITITLYLAYGFSNTPPSDLSIPSISSSAQISWQENQQIYIEAEDLEGAMMALGAAHAINNAWQMNLWRQTAMGSLTEWFGPNLLYLDRFTKNLRFAALAQETYDQLPGEYTRLLDAYAEGVNAALQDTEQITQNELTLLNTSTTPWEPWHSLAIERMFAWLSLDLHSLKTDSLDMSHSDWDAILLDDRGLKEWLQLHGFHHSIAGTWPVDTLSGRTIFHRLVYGSSAIPFLQEVRLDVENRPETYLATVPGTLLFPSGHQERASWLILPYSSGQLTVFQDAIQAITTYKRIQSLDGSEVLLTLKSYPGWLLQNDSQTPEDSMIALAWKGFTPGSDIPAFISLLSNEEPSFDILDGNGLTSFNESWSILGAPRFVHELQEGVLIGSSPWSTYQASRLNNLLRDPSQSSPENWPQDCHNDWAEDVTTFLLEDYLLRRISFDEEYSDALTYLRNWDYTYSPSSIGAIIFDSWLKELPDSLYQKVITKELTPSDTLPRMYLQKSISSLKENFGDDLSKWRLDITKPIQRSFPAWNADSLFKNNSEQLSQSLYAPLTFPGRGHAGTLCWGSIQIDNQPEVSSRWDGWTTVHDNSPAFFWRKHEAPDSFLGRYLIFNTPNSTYSSLEAQHVKARTEIN